MASTDGLVRSDKQDSLMASPKSSKHLSQPYNMQSISTESLPALFGAASLRRTNSNIISKTRPSRGTSPAPHSFSTPTSPGLGSSSPSPPNPPQKTPGPLSPSSSPVNGSTTGAKGEKGAKGTAGTTTSPSRRPPIDVFDEQFELGETHDRRPSSWDIMDMLAIDQLRQWMVCFCVVNFDLEKGQGK
ncbi:hypothetical protein CPC16_010036 [Podila verticillata]|nr:hypothetical protein CPC16_010036 [Podila verticillata]